MNKYLEDFMCDGEAWMELCEIYILEQEYTKAAFCCEELILQNPHNISFKKTVRLVSSNAVELIRVKK